MFLFFASDAHLKNIDSCWRKQMAQDRKQAPHRRTHLSDPLTGEKQQKVFKKQQIQKKAQPKKKEGVAETTKHITISKHIIIIIIIINIIALGAHPPAVHKRPPYHSLAFCEWQVYRHLNYINILLYYCIIVLLFFFFFFFFLLLLLIQPKQKGPQPPATIWVTGGDGEH